ncbi:hypothetical protein ACFLYB_04425 [Chloroflexota bacterium]
MTDIKSSREIALQKTDNLGEPTTEDRLRWKYVPKGEKLAVECLRKRVDINEKLSVFKEEAKRYIKKGMESVFLANIELPRNETIKNNNELIMGYLRCIKNEKTLAEEVINSFGQLFEHYEEQGKQQREQVYGNLKLEYGEKLRQAVEKQLGMTETMDMDMDVEKLPQFHREWQQAQAQLDSQYIKLLNDYRLQLKAIE